MDKLMARRGLCFGILFLLSVAVFWEPLNLWVRFSNQYEHLSHVILIPGVSLVLLWWDREKVFSTLRWSVPYGLGLFVVAGAIYAVGVQNAYRLSQHDYLAVVILALALTWLAIFVACFGTISFRAATFPMLFLLLMVPIPEFLLAKTITALQYGSAEVSAWFFQLTPVPVYRDGLFFALPGLAIEVAEECSGIRSSIALLITALLASHLFLKTGWAKLVLVLSVIPLALIKNAVRIVGISLLSVYVDPDFMVGRLHRRGGIVFFMITLVLMGIILFVLQRAERRKRGPGRPSAPAPEDPDDAPGEEPQPLLKT